MNKYTRVFLIGAGITLAALYSPGCKNDESPPIVVMPRGECCCQEAADYGRPELSRQNPFERRNAKEQS